MLIITHRAPITYSDTPIISLSHTVSRHKATTPGSSRPPASAGDYAPDVHRVGPINDASDWTSSIGSYDLVALTSTHREGLHVGPTSRIVLSHVTEGDPAS